MVDSPIPVPTDTKWARAFYRQRERATCRSSSQLWQLPWNWSSVVWPASSWLFWVQLIFSSLIAQLVKNLPAVQETWVRFLGREDSPGEGNGNPLQYSCLKNPMDRGAWRATGHGVARVARDWVTLTTTTNLRFQSRFVSISLRPVLGAVAVYVTASV